MDFNSNYISVEEPHHVEAQQQYVIGGEKLAVEYFEGLLEKVKGVKDPIEKVKILDEQPMVQQYLARPSMVREFLDEVDNIVTTLAIKSVLALGQGDIVFRVAGDIENKDELMKQLVGVLVETEKFYSNIGGIIGYHCAVIQLLAAKEDASRVKKEHYYRPESIDITEENNDVRKAILAGLERMSEMAELYPVGGAGDRLDLHDEVNGLPLPAAKLPFCGRTLLEGMIRDLEGREFLHYKVFGRQLTTPIAMMTSQEKDNHRQIIGICEACGWFGRPPSSFTFFQQPLVPVINKDGNWSLHRPLMLTLKPGGHGVIWKLARDHGAFRWLRRLGCHKILLRQINNPVAGVDSGLLAFTGIGLLGDKTFGFAACSRLINTSEGTNVLIEKEDHGSFSYCMTNVEYTDFTIKGIEDVPAEPGSKWSAFPSNTNILFADIATIEGLVDRSPVPGMSINMKNVAPFIALDGTVHQVPAGRLEAMMQNIADYIVDRYDKRLSEGQRCRLSSYLTFNERRKTISVTKNSYVSGKPIAETPEGCFYDLMHNVHELLECRCNMKVPAWRDEEEYLEQGPNMVVLYHPALGPTYSIIAQKIQSGELKEGAEMQLEISELEMRDLYLDGSLLIDAKNVMGDFDANGFQRYGESSGKCALRDVHIVNAGIDRSAMSTPFWRNTFPRKEALRITLHGNAEFYAEGVSFKGNYEIEVPAGVRMVAYEENKEIRFRSEKLHKPSWWWHYSIGDGARIILQKMTSP